LAQAFFGLLVVIAMATSARWSSLTSSSNHEALKRVRIVAITTAIVIYIQLALGATMRHQHRDLAILDFPTANGSWLPETSPAALARINAWRDTRALSDVTAFQIWLHMAHRFGAIIVAGGTLALWSAVRKPGLESPLLGTLSNLLVGLVGCQIALGAWTIWSNKAADVATTHVAVGATIFAVAVAVCAICYRLSWIGPSVEFPVAESSRLTVTS
ncbi:MAG TPA: COX15/CtaA family protein, partial [Chthoniobacterales bacterium]